MRDGTNSIAGGEAESGVERLWAAAGWLSTPLLVAFLFALCFATDAKVSVRRLLSGFTVALAGVLWAGSRTVARDMLSRP